ncbi:MAG: hypothetical protein SOY06_02025 [Prevotella sp.]|nr:hypothetical protein [Bacteroidales bacterium]MDY4228615.1 hypothetical protein [Prevotella sp.]MCI7598142.1 hypothetical protein [Bacteroidales bacterium]MCI7653127.1 hypothetical protein [Bacteroidales bacterium]MDD7705685.1 hypothetical protein [Bacteroidales bacterium]
MYYNPNGQRKKAKFYGRGAKDGQKNAHNSVVCAGQRAFLFKKFAQLK